MLINVRRMSWAMPITMTWLEQPYIPAFVFSTRVTEEDIDALGTLGLQIAENRHVYPIIDFSSVNIMPRNLINTTLRARSLLAFIKHDNVRLFVFVAPDEQTRYMIDTVFRNLPYKIAPTRDYALKLSQEELSLETE